MFLSVKRSSHLARLHIDWDYPNFAQSTDNIVGVCQVKQILFKKIGKGNQNSNTIAKKY
jgi:hypothetical protein